MASKQILDEIRNRISIVSLIGERVPLKKSGRNFKGLCPFHQEKTPSFIVSEEKQIFHCFGCASGGDIFTFLMKMDGFGFAEALSDLAKRAGVKLPARDKGVSPQADEESLRQKKWALRLNQIALEFFTENIKKPEGDAARRYLEKRGIRPETATQHFLGFADKGWEALVQRLQDLKAPLKLALGLGLIREREKEGGYYDFFRGRLMFPILDIKGSVVGFSGRALDPADGAKYLNSPDSFLYHKSELVYGLNWAKESIRNLDEVILVEGNIDLITLREVGIENAAAPLGTALTSDQLKLLSRYTKNFVVAFDGDDAGRQAAFRSLTLFLELGLSPKAIPLPKDTDPDNFIRENGKEAFEELKSKAPTLFEYFMDHVISNASQGTQGALQSWDQIRPLLEKVKNPLEQGIYRKQVAEKLGVEESWLKGGPGTRDQGPGTKNFELRTLNLEQPYPEEERLLIAAMILKPKLIETMPNPEEIFSATPLKNLAEDLFQKQERGETLSLAALHQTLEPKLGSWIREMALLEEEDAVWEKALKDCLAKIAMKGLEVQLSRINQEIASAEKGGDEKTLLKLLAEKSKLTELKMKKREYL